MKQIYSKALLVIIFVVVIAGTFFWFQQSEIRNETSGLSEGVDEITVVLKWTHQSQFAGNYVAAERGFYADHNIKATLIPFDFVHFPIPQVVDGEAEFGVTGASELLLARADGSPVVALATIYQDNPVVAYALRGSGIREPADLLGKRIGIQEGTNVEVVIRNMMANQNLDFDSVQATPIQFDVQPVIDGEVDVATGYLTNEPIQLEERGYEVNVINPTDYGVSRYADVLFTTEDMIEKNPDLVQRFVDATLQGWRYALEHKEDAVNDTLQYKDPNNPALNFDHQMKLLERSAPLIKPSAGIVIGQMDFANWKKTHDLMRQGGLLEENLNLTDAYTTEFLQ